MSILCLNSRTNLTENRSYCIHVIFSVSLDSALPNNELPWMSQGNYSCVLNIISYKNCFNIVSSRLTERSNAFELSLSWSCNSKSSSLLHLEHNKHSFEQRSWFVRVTGLIIFHFSEIHLCSPQNRVSPPFRSPPKTS